MKIISINILAEILGGYYSMVAYPMLGCGSGMGITYIRNPNATHEDYGRACLKGALHGLNPGFNMIGGAISNPYGRYVVAYAYSSGLNDAVDRMLPLRRRENEMHCGYTCPISIESGPIAFGAE